MALENPKQRMDALNAVAYYMPKLSPRGDKHQPKLIDTLMRDIPREKFEKHNVAYKLFIGPEHPNILAALHAITPLALPQDASYANFPKKYDNSTNPRNCIFANREEGYEILRIVGAA